MNTGLKREGYEKYYTKTSVVEKLLVNYKKIIKNDEHALWIEPSAGNGSFTIYLGDRNLLAYDIQPQGPGILEQDFLKLNLSLCFHIPVHFIGNPAFLCLPHDPVKLVGARHLWHCCVRILTPCNLFGKDWHVVAITCVWMLNPSPWSDSFLTFLHLHSGSKTGGGDCHLAFLRLINGPLWLVGKGVTCMAFRRTSGDPSHRHYDTITSVWIASTSSGFQTSRTILPSGTFAKIADKNL